MTESLSHFHNRTARTSQAIIAFAVLILASLATLACSSGESVATPAPTEPPASTARTGEEIFTTTCVACHQAGGVGQSQLAHPE